MFDIKFTKITIIGKVILNISPDCLEYDGLNKKVKNANKYKVDEILKLTIKIYRTLPKKSIPYYLKHRIPLCHRQFSRIFSQNPEYVRTQCNNFNNHFPFACRKWTNQLN